ncbi:MAG TPA: VanZ family protein [Burkholderiales bacterium]|nr:VanZ family protein [Burkholderiales bacterium]
MNTSNKWPGQSLITFLAMGYLAFVVYGSLVPFDYQPALAAERLLQFLDQTQFEWYRQSRADVVTNVLLTMPLAFLWCAVLTSGGRRWGFAAPCIVFVGSLCVSFLVEWLQTYYPPRDPSLVDVLAQTVGSALSIILWATRGARFLNWIAGIQLLTSIPSISARLLILYGVALFAYGIFPLDLTLSVTDFYRKLRDGKVLLLPFLEWRHVNAKLLYGFFTDIALWIPVGVLARLSFRWRTLSIVLVGTLAAAMLESLQLFVLSRTSDMTQVVAAFLGVVIGAQLSKRFADAPTAQAPMARGNLSGIIAPLLVAMGWFLLICAVFWYPYNFQIRPDTTLARTFFYDLPLESLFYQGELRAVTELLRKTLFFAPLGALLAFAVAPVRAMSPQFPAMLLASLALFLAAVWVEGGKFFLPGKYPGGTNVAMEFFGGLMGYWAATAGARWRVGAIHSGMVTEPAVFPASSLSQRGTAGGRPEVKPKPISIALKLACAIFLAGTTLWVLTKVPQVPYNFRNLPHPSYRYLSMLLVAAALIWSAGFPAWFARRLATDPRALGRYPLWLLIYGLVAWILTFVAVEPLRAYKIVGSPILHWPWHFEWLLRFLALMGGIGGFAVLGSIIGGDGRYFRQRFALWLIHAIWLLPLVYWAVVIEAATDNIVELLAWNAGPGAALLAGLVITTIFFAATRTHGVFSTASSGARARSLAWVLVSFPLGYWLLQMATDPVVVKYDKVFSGMQFILSSDREHYAQGGALFVRYLVFHLFFLMASAIARALFLESPTRSPSSR